MLTEGIEVQSHQVRDVNGDGIADLTIAFSRGGGSATLLGVSDFSAVDIDSGFSALFGATQPDLLGLQPNQLMI